MDLSRLLVRLYYLKYTRVGTIAGTCQGNTCHPFLHGFQNTSLISQLADALADLVIPLQTIAEHSKPKVSGHLCGMIHSLRNILSQKSAVIAFYVV